jgi:ribosomal protein S18 acetylase RimI-like enzyme
MLIRRLAPSDAPAYQALRLHALRECPLAFGSSHEEEHTRSMETVAQWLSQHCMFGAFEGEQLAGLVGIAHTTALKERHKAAIRGMYVAAGHRQAGLGRRLLEHALQVATREGLRQLTLVASAGNDAAIRLYRSLGFETYGIEPAALLVDGMLYDDVHMVRLLDAA